MEKLKVLLVKVIPAVTISVRTLIAVTKWFWLAYE